MTEDQLHRQILHYCRAVLPKSCMVWHPANGGHRNKVTAAKLKGLGVMPGTPDLVIMYPHERILFAEIKTDKGRVSQAQRTWSHDAQNIGFTVAVWRGIDDARNTFTALGIKTKDAK